MPTRSEEILALVETKIDRAQQSKENAQEEISLLNASKEPHKAAINALDTLLFDETDGINDAIDERRLG